MSLAHGQRKYGERAGEKEMAMQAMQVTLPQQSTKTSEDCVERYCRSDTSCGSCCHLLIASGTAAFTTAYQSARI